MRSSKCRDQTPKSGGAKFSPDHGQDILDDLARGAQPGYPAIGRLKGLAAIRGIVRTLEHPQFGM